MNKKDNKKTNIALYFTIVAVIGIGAAMLTPHMLRKKARREVARLSFEVQHNKDSLHTYLVQAPEFQENRQMKKNIDSLKGRNITMFLDAQEKYFERTEKKYPLGRFMNNGQLAQLNGVVMPYVSRVPKSDINVYNLLKKLTPFNARTTISEFESVLHLLNIPSEKFAPLDMVVDQGFLFMFNDRKQQAMLESYLEELSMAFSESDVNMPNFDIRENAAIRDEYMRNQDKIRNLEFRIEQNDFLIGQTIARFNQVDDSLNTLRDRYRAKLTRTK